MIGKASNPGWIRRWLAVGCWALVALVYLVYFWLDLRLDYTQLLEPCQGAACNWMAVSSAEVEVLGAWGLSTHFYAVFMTGAALANVAVYWLLGGLLLWRQGPTRIGFSVSLALLIIPITLIADSGNVYTAVPGLLIPWAILSGFGRVFSILFIYLFPNGRFYPRWAVIPLAAAVLVTLFSVMLEIGGIVPYTPLQNALLLTTFALAFAGGFSQILRYLQVSTLIERQQTKWALLGIVILIISVPFWILFFGGGLALPSGGPRLLGAMGGWILVMLLIAALPFTLTIAILRYRLFEIDLIIRRTLQYTLLTGVLSGVYFGGVALMQAVLTADRGPSTAGGTAVSGPPSAVVVLTTLLIAALFNPLRRRIQDFIDRRFYRQKYDAERALADFAAAARSQTDLEQLSIQLTHTIQETLQPYEVMLWLCPSKNQQNQPES